MYSHRFSGYETVNLNIMGIAAVIEAVARCRETVPGGTREVEVPRFLQAQAVLDDAQLREMANLGLSLEER